MNPRDIYESLYQLGFFSILHNWDAEKIYGANLWPVRLCILT